MAAQPDYKCHSILLSIILAAEPQSAHHHFTRAHAGDFLHHFARLLELFQKTVHVLHRRAAAPGDSCASAPVDNQMVAAFLQRHRVDDCLDALELAPGPSAASAFNNKLRPSPPTALSP